MLEPHGSPSLPEFPGHPLVSHMQSLPGHLNCHVTALSVFQRKKISGPVLGVIVDTMNVLVLFTVFFHPQTLTANCVQLTVVITAHFRTFKEGTQLKVNEKLKD